LNITAMRFIASSLRKPSVRSKTVTAVTAFFSVRSKESSIMANSPAGSR